ncbi:hypothetical protein BEP19_03225 [Ammoniphilus oxalaticus]|uniref:Uncharacterized protein n=1 Tax=Ammoniphilus oxalaticus TaxID=66863 RepID=A0A419SNS0_9BACL|nr:hypothetical protein [Ammoniphilus oxalaticus]RKD25950.1 hypothetical protein BEP19_03225 [Ammoniphilus oxalaticus]
MIEEQELIHILRSQMNESLRAALSDFVSLSGVMTEFSSADFWRDTERVLETLRLLDLVLQATLYKGEWQLRDDNAIVHRYNRLYEQYPRLDVTQFLNVCRKYNWITSAKNPPLRLQSTGKRMIGHLFRIANDAFAYHLQPEDQQALYQAIRDAKLGEAYEDEGIGGGEVLASMISNLEDVSEQLELNIQRYIYEGKGNQKVQEIDSILDQVKEHLEARFEKSADLIPDNRLQNLSERAHRAFADAHRVAYPALGQTAISSVRRQDKRITQINVNEFLRYLSNCAQLEFRNINDQVGLIDLMEPLGDENDDGLGIWWPQQLPKPLTEDLINRGLEELERIFWMEPVTSIDEEIEMEFTEPETVSTEQLKELQGQSASLAEEYAFNTKRVEEYLRDLRRERIDSLLVEISNTWEEAANHLLSVSALISHHLAYLEQMPLQTDLSKLVPFRLGHPDEDRNLVWVVQASEKLLNKAKG